MDRHLRKTDAAERRICNRIELASLLGADPQFICDVVGNSASFYGEFSIPKLNGELRTIRPPRKPLRRLQRTILEEIAGRVQMRDCLHGGIPRRSIVTHAQSHVGQTMVATLDIRKFFPGTTAEHLCPVLTYLGFAEQALEDLMQLITFNGQLPEGGPASSLLANLAFARGDTRFIELSRRRRLRYSRYVDDIAVSGSGNFADLKGPFEDAIRSAGYSIAKEKIHFRPRNERQVVTGLVVNDKMRPTKKFLGDLKFEIQVCLSHGARATAISKGMTVQQLKNQLTGRVAHVRHIERRLGQSLRGKLCGIDWKSSSRNDVGGN